MATAMNTVIVARCSYNKEVHVIDFDGNSTLPDLMDQIRDRWSEVDPQNSILKYHTPDKGSDLVVIRNDNDLRNMYRWHVAGGVPHASIVVERKRLQFTGAPPPPQPPPQPPQPTPVEASSRYLNDTDLNFL
jgi:hypothetical protein